MEKPMPAVFFGHGNPMNAIRKNDWTAGWAAIGRDISRPRGVLCVSAHWYLPATMVTAMIAPRTIHDFGGFPRELYEVQYKAPGDPQLARRVQELLALLPIALGPGRLTQSPAAYSQMVRITALRLYNCHRTWSLRGDFRGDAAEHLMFKSRHAC